VGVLQEETINTMQKGEGVIFPITVKETAGHNQMKIQYKPEKKTELQKVSNLSFKKLSKTYQTGENITSCNILERFKLLSDLAKTGKGNKPFLNLVVNTPLKASSSFEN
jgi:hypothetical protein